MTHQLEIIFSLRESAVSYHPSRQLRVMNNKVFIVFLFQCLLLLETASCKGKKTKHCSQIEQEGSVKKKRRMSFVLSQAWDKEKF